MKPALLQLDGSAGGGQILRSALSLSMLTGRPFRMVGIRGGRRRPGLMRQHLACVRAACAVSGGVADGAEIGSTEIVFRPGRVEASEYRFAIGSGGSAGLLFQTLLPPLLAAGKPSALRLEGGTHNPLAPPFEFLQRVYLPALALAGAEATLELAAVGFAPGGGGVYEARVEPCAGWRPIEIVERAEPGPVRLRVIRHGLPDSITDRALAAARGFFPEAEFETVDVAALGGVTPEKPDMTDTTDTTDTSDVPGPATGTGLCLQAEVACGPLREIASGFAQFGLSAERVGRAAAKPLRDYLGSGAPVGRHLADQLLLPMALAGEGRLRTMAPDAHVPTNIAVIEAFLPVHFRIDRGERGNFWIDVGPA